MARPASGGGTRRGVRRGKAGPPSPLAIVVISASAANMGSLERLFSNLQDLRGLAYVVSLRFNGVNSRRVTELLSDRSPLPAEVAKDGVRLEADRIYVGNSEDLIVLDDGRLSLNGARQFPGHRGAIDSVLVTLAEGHGERAIGILLHGMGSDGIAGVTALKEHGGLALAEADGAEGDVDPALDPAGLVDFVLGVEEMPERLSAYVGYLAAHPDGPRKVAADIEADTAQHISRVASILRNKTGHDFHGYKHNTFLRRIQRRMQVRQIEDLERYVEFLRTDSEEIGHLFQDLLIGVTQFFRDGPEFALLEREVVPKLFEGKGAGDQVRVWVLGCATGEEAYSLAMLLREHAATLDAAPQIQIFATDIDGRALSMARAGRYAESIAGQISPERLARWFSKEGATYSVSKELREICIFSQHNVIRDAPLSRTDLVSCRNLLIYLTSELQDRVIPLFHFSLRPGGFLFLGPSENLTRHLKLFAPFDRRHRMFRRQETLTRSLPVFPLSTGERPRGVSGAPAHLPRPRLENSLGRRAEQVVERYAPAYVLIDQQYEVLHFSGRTGRYLEPAAGAANLNLLTLVHRDLRLDLRAALHAAAADNATITAPRLRFPVDGVMHALDLVVEPISGPDIPTSFVVLFNDGGPVNGEPGDRPLPSSIRGEHVERLESELRLTKERLQATIEELESTNEELKSSNEEYQSINEELQSANEELETSKEELQSLNEELQTVNGELAHRVHELARANSDLKNLLESTQIATIFLDNDLRVKSFTPSVADIFHLIEIDLGRPITHITSRIGYDELEFDVRRVLRTLGVVEREVGDPVSGSRFLVRVLPYRSVDNFIAGVVITFMDVTATVKAEAAAQAATDKVREILESIADGFFAVDQDLNFTYVNHEAMELLDQRRDQVIGQSLRRLLPQPKFEALHAGIGEAARSHEPVEVEFVWPGLSRWTAVSIYPAAIGYSVFMRDVGERHRSAARQRLLTSELQHRVKNILAVVRSITSRTLESSHDLDDFSARFDGRLQTLARTQAVLARRAGEDVDLEQMIREELLTHAVPDEAFEVSGPAILLRQKAAETLALVLHELATNAVKYGAFSTSQGRVSVTWRRTGGKTLSFRWSESGAATVDLHPRRRGFGRELIEQGLPYDLPGSKTSLSFTGGGAQCAIELPLNQYTTVALSNGGASERDAPQG